MTVTILKGDCRDVLKTLESDSVHLCVSSPPYFGLRDYGVAGQIGLEPTPADFVEAMVNVFREVRRVLRPDGTLWLNLGDSYAGSWGAQSRGNTTGEGKSTITGKTMLSARQIAAHPQGLTGTGSIKRTPGMKPKDLMLIPHTVAAALRADGWWLRQTLPWVKRNPMPESTNDRPTSAVEYVFHLAKSDRYFYDYEAVRRAMAPSSIGRLAQDVDAQAGSARANGGAKTNGTMKAVGGDKQRGHSRRHAGFNDRWDKMERDEQRGERAFRNTDLFFASVDGPHGAIGNEQEIIALDVATHSFKEAHFATFPPALIEPLIKAGCPLGGTVLDPFGGAGTTGMVADRLGRNAILIELNPEYAAIADKRISADAGLFANVV